LVNDIHSSDLLSKIEWKKCICRSLRYFGLGEIELKSYCDDE
jgi:hypothetical protein